MNKLHYNYVFFFARYDFWRNILGEELYSNKHVRIYKEAFSGSRVLEKIFHFHWAYSINKKICLPFKRLWFKRMYPNDFEDNLPIVFVYLAGGTIYYGKEFLNYVKKRNPNNKNVMLYEDLLERVGEKEHYLLKELVDLEITYDVHEAEKYGIAYFQEITYSKLIPEPKTIDFVYDIFFLGAAKDRLPKIMEAYYYFNSKGFKCKFIIADVPKEQQIQADDIEYNYISYEENIKYIIKSRCVLEIIQGGSCDITTRAVEAMAYKRKFITDCPLELSSYFNNGQLIQYKTIDEVSTEFVKAHYDPGDFQPRIDLDPTRRLYFIQEKLEKK